MATAAQRRDMWDKIISRGLLVGVSASIALLISLHVRLSVSEAERRANDRTVNVRLENLQRQIDERERERDSDTTRERVALERSIAEIGGRALAIEGRFREHEKECSASRLRLARLEERLSAIEKEKD